MATDHNPALSPRLPARPRVAQARARARSRSAAVAASLALLSLLGLAACSSSTDQANPPTPTIESLTELPPPPPFDKEQADKDIKKVYEKYQQALVDIQTKDYETQKTFLDRFVTDNYRSKHPYKVSTYNSNDELRLDPPDILYGKKVIDENSSRYYLCLDLVNTRYKNKESGLTRKYHDVEGFPENPKAAYLVNFMKDSNKGWVINESEPGIEDAEDGIYKEACK